MDWNDLSGAFGQLLGDVVGDQESRDALPPPPPKIALSARLQRFANVLLGPMQKSWDNFVVEFKQGGGQGWEGSYENLGGIDIVNAFKYLTYYKLDPDSTDDHDITAKGYAVEYLNYYQWVDPYIIAIRNVIEGNYTGGDYTKILDFLQVTEDDFNGNMTSYGTYVLPWMRRAYQQAHAFESMGLKPSLPAPVLPDDYSNFVKRAIDSVLGNEKGQSPNALSNILAGVGGTLLVLGGIAFLALYLLTAKH